MPQQHKIELQAEPRTVLGSGVKHLRRDGYIPGILYGKGLEPVPVQVPIKDFSRTLNEAGESTLVYLKVNDQSYPTIIHDVMRDPRKDTIIHADFYKVRLDEKIKTMVPVVFEGESPAVKEQNGIFVRSINELEVEALPQDLPHEISIDISKMINFGDQILIKDVKLGDKAKVLGNEEDIIALIKEPLTEEQLKAMLEGDQKTVADVEVGEVKPEGEEVTEEGAEGEGAPAPAADESKPDDKK